MILFVEANEQLEATPVSTDKYKPITSVLKPKHFKFPLSKPARQKVKFETAKLRCRLIQPSLMNAAPGAAWNR